MRFISKIKHYDIVFQIEFIEHYATGESREIRQFIDCQFDPGISMLPHEMAAARASFVDHGLPTDVDRVTTIDPAYRYSVFDTRICQQRKGFDDETREKMEQFLLGREELGVDFIMVGPVQLAPPWPNYDSFEGRRGMSLAAAIVAKVREDGYPVEDVIAYEQQNANRSEVIDALESIASIEDVPVFDDEEGLVEA